MTHRSRGQVVLGLGLVALGTMTIVLGLWHSTLVPRVGSVNPDSMAVATGFIFLLAGSLSTAFSFRPAVSEETAVSAAVTFRHKHVAPMLVPDHVAMPSRQRVRDVNDPMHKLDQEIRELSRRINRASVLLGTGQLSEEGYRAYVADLKKERGVLEAQRVRLELRQRSS